MDPILEGGRAGRAARDAALLAAEPWEFRNFLCGTTPPPEIPEPEATAFRTAANRALGTALGLFWGGAKTVEFRRPEARFVLRLPSGAVEIVVAPLYVYGRYRKHSRALAQTPFHCRSCRGTGCEVCGGSGRHLPGSLSEFLVPLLVEASGAERGSFSGCGREDADARMLGRGRPFVVLLERPRRRSLDWESIRTRAGEAAAGAAEFPVLRAVGHEEARRVPASRPAKRYLARVEVEGGAGAEDAARLGAALSGAVLRQRTPVRVSRRRADLVRERRVLDASARPAEDGLLDLEVRTEAGTYVKEMVSGDGGRTEPSASSILGRPCRCTALDVLEVEMEDPPPA